MIEFVNVSKTYGLGKSIVLKNLNLKISQGEFICIVGRSGAGKTTLLNLMTLHLKPESGKILIEGRDITKVRDRDRHLLRRKIGVVYQDIKLLTGRTVFENVAFAMEVNGIEDKIIRRNVPKILELVGLKDKINSFPLELSGGEQQRVAIARAIALKPVLLIADEPTGNLDEGNGAEVIELLLKINELGTTVLLATHAANFVDKIKKRVITIEDGELVRDQAKGKYSI